MFCRNCGKEISDNAYVCPNCGVKVATENEAPNNTMAIVGFVLSFFVSIAGLIVSIIALKRSNEMDGTGKGLATAGIIISIVSMVVYIFAIIMIVVAFTATLSTLPNYYYMIAAL